MMVIKKNSKVRILLVWNYERRDWIQPFLDLSDQFHFIFLSKYSEKDDRFIANTKGIERIYWTSYSSPASIINTVLPEAIAFMSLNNFPDIILNRVAQKKGIPTAILQHGLYFSQGTYKEKIKQTANVGKVADDASSRVSKRWMMQYFLSGICQGMETRQGVSLIKYLFKKTRSSDIETLDKNRFLARMPDKLIVYTKANARVFEERDGLHQSIMIEIGNPALDKYFDQSPLVNLDLPFGSYILLIDTPLFIKKGVPRGFGFSLAEAKGFYERILSYARSRQMNLVIKLHPYSYSEDSLLVGKDIFYVKDEYDHKSLIYQANAILSFPSTLAIPAIYFKPVLLLKFGENDFLEIINKNGLLPVVNISELKDSSPDPVWNQEARELLISMCLYKTDGQSLQRLKMAFNDLCRR